MAIILRHATLAQLGAAFRQRYLAAKGPEVFRLATWLVNRINDGTFTETQVRNFFGLSVAQWNNLKAKWQDWKAKYDEMTAAVGE
jgi:hypothetical protein